jgi:transcriptional regulator with XRE-family HTH domain
MLMSNLEVAMDHRRLTIRDVAKLAGLSHGTVHNVLKAKGWVDLRTVARLETALGEPLSTSGPSGIGSRLVAGQA